MGIARWWADGCKRIHQGGVRWDDDYGDDGGTVQLELLLGVSQAYFYLGGQMLLH